MRLVRSLDDLLRNSLELSSIGASSRNSKDVVAFGEDQFQEEQCKREDVEVWS